MTPSAVVVPPPLKMVCTPAVDDNDMLRAVMAFLDDGLYEAADLIEMKHEQDATAALKTASPCPIAPTVSLTSAVSTVSRPRMINRSRLRRRHELLSLREQVIALQETLNNLNEVNSTKHTATDGGKAREVRVGAWRAIAEFQREQLEAAESERDALRLLVRKRKTIIRRVERFVNERMLHQPIHGLFKLPMGVKTNKTSNLGGFDDLSRNFSSMYLQVGHIFEDARFQSVQQRLHEMKYIHGDCNNLSTEMLGSVLLPFDVQTVAEAVWKFHFIKAHKVTVDAEESLEERGDQLRRTFTATMKLPSMSGVVRGRMETRRIVEEDRVMILQFALFDGVDVAASSDVDRFSIQQLWWTVIRPPRDMKRRSLGSPLCQVECLSVSIPSFLESMSPHHREVAMQFCIDAADVALASEHQAVENLLLSSNLS